MYELKWDGFRCVIVRDGQSTRLWSRQGTDLTNRFPEIAVAAAAQIPAGTVIDGEVVIWNEDRLDFDLLQRRLVSGVARIRELVKTHQASFVAFDLLAAAGTDLRTQPWRSRRDALERAVRWEPPLQLSPTTEDTSVARAWMADRLPPRRNRRPRRKRSHHPIHPRETQSADTGVQAGVWRHPLRYLRHRPDLTPTDLPTLI